ncbi:MAG: transglycosylase SLT domain-containing protein [Patescibacteria group bacterium]|nr:transglycosylase SLT domain-containing protein [Patescibacteria group bacterium]
MAVFTVEAIMQSDEAICFKAYVLLDRLVYSINKHMPSNTVFASPLSYRVVDGGTIRTPKGVSCKEENRATLVKVAREAFPEKQKHSLSNEKIWENLVELSGRVDLIIDQLASSNVQQEDSLLNEAKKFVAVANSFLVKQEIDSSWQTMKIACHQKDSLLDYIIASKEDIVSAKVRSIYGPDSAQDILFPRDIEFGMTGEDVRLLQIVLNKDPETQLAESGYGSPGRETNFFGESTKDAVRRFQEKYANEILIPMGLDSANCFVGPNSRKKLKSLLGQEITGITLVSGCEINDLQVWANRFDLTGLPAEVLRQLDVLGINYTQDSDNDKPSFVKALDRTNQYQSSIKEQSEIYRLSPNQPRAVIINESLGKAWVTSHSGATGLMQLMYSTAKDLEVNRYDSDENIKGGCKYLSHLKYNHPNTMGDNRKVFKGYNWGPNYNQCRYEKAEESRLPSESRIYSSSVLATWTILNWIDEIEVNKYQICQADEGQNLIKALTNIQNCESEFLAGVRNNLRREYYAQLKEVNPFLTMVPLEVYMG